MSTSMVSRIGRVVAEGRTDFISRSVQPPADHQVVIRIRASALCGSDLHIFKAKHPTVSLPATIGHEFSGDIVAVGKNVERLRPGDRVTVEPCESCGVCDACRRGEYGSCDALTFIYRRGDGAMADYITVKAESVFPLPDNLSYEAGALIEPLAVAVHAVRRANIRMSETVAVIGAGAIGLLAAALCRHSGASKVMVSDYSAFRLDMAKALGATHVVNPGAGEDLEAVVRRETGGRGADKVLECVGREETFVQAMTLLRKQGLATVVGIFEQPMITIPVMKLVGNEIRIQGSQGYCWDFPAALEIAEKLDLEKLITHRFQLDELQQALTMALDPTRHTVKIILRP